MRTISIVAHPNSRKPRIEKDTKGTLHIYVAVRPQDGKANEHIIAALARHLGIAPSLLRITRGLRSKQKTIQVN